MRGDGADTAFGVDSDADVFGKTNVGLADAAVDFHVEVGLSIAGEVYVDLADADFDAKLFQVNFTEFQIAASGVHFHLKVNGNGIVETHAPSVVGGAKRGAIILLRNIQVGCLSGNVVLDARARPRCGVIEIALDCTRRSAGYVEFAGGHMN